MGSFLFDLAIRIVNASIGAFIGFLAMSGRWGRRLSRLTEIDQDTLMPYSTVAVAAIGFIWGAKIWSRSEKRDGWIRRGP